MLNNKFKTPTSKLSNSKVEDPLSLILLNFQSVMSKKESFWEILDSCSPDIVVGCETWLTPLILNNEIIPNNYNLYRTDRSDGYGGVLIGVNANLISETLHTNSSCEICAVRILTFYNQELIIIGTYRPPNRDVLYQQELCDCICGIIREHPSASIFCAGDLNLPDIDWTNESITGDKCLLAINNFKYVC